MADNVTGFQGAVAGLSLTDVIQLKGHNRYTGCITVSYGDSEGAIYFADGEIIHAELGDKTGEEAIYQIIKWPGGTFNMHPEMTSNICTIHYRTDFLLLEALRRLDEENAGASQPADGERPPVVTPRRTMSKIAARLIELDGVTYSTLLEKDGATVQDSSIEAAALAQKALLMAKSGGAIGSLMGLGDVKASAIKSSNFNLLLYDSKHHYLSIAAKPDVNLEQLESEIKSLLVPGR